MAEVSVVVPTPELAVRCGVPVVPVVSVVRSWPVMASLTLPMILLMMN